MEIPGTFCKNFFFLEFIFYINCRCGCRKQNNVVKVTKTPQPIYITVSSLNLHLEVLICLRGFEITSIYTYPDKLNAEYLD